MIYGGELLSLKPASQVLLCASVAEAEAAQLLFPSLVAVAYDAEEQLNRLSGRRVVVIWSGTNPAGTPPQVNSERPPDPSGALSAAHSPDLLAARLYSLGASEVKVLEWDVTAALADNMAPADAIAFAKKNAVVADRPPADAPSGPENVDSADSEGNPVGEDTQAPFPPLEAYLDEPDSYYVNEHGILTIEEGKPAHLRVAIDNTGLSHRSLPVEKVYGDWPQPSNPFEGRLIPAFKPDWMPEVLADFAMDQAECTGFDAGMLALQCVIVAAGLASDEITVRVRPNQRWLESPRLWGMIIGSPSCGKSPSLNIAMREAKRLNNKIIEETRARKADYDLQMKVYEAQEKAYIAALTKGEPAQKPMKPDRPADNQVYVDDITKDAISEALRGSYRGVLLRKDELAGWIEGFDGYTGNKGNERQVWLELYNGGERPINRIGRGNMVIENWSASIIGGIQPDALMRLAGRLNMAEDGLIQRFLPYWALDKRDESDRAENYDYVRRWESCLSRLYAMRCSLDHIVMSEGAQRVRQEANDWIKKINRAVEQPPAMPEFLAKWGSMLPRLALVYHCIESADAVREAVDGELSEETMRRAWRFLHEGIYHHAREMYLLVSGTSGSNAPLKSVCAAILANDMQGFDRTELSQKCSTYRTAIRAKKEEIIFSLIEGGWIRGLGNPDKVTKQVGRFAVNPLVFDGRFERRRAYEKTLRAERLERMKMNFHGADGADGSAPSEMNQGLG